MSSTTLSEEDKTKYILIIDTVFRNSDLSTVSVKKVRNSLSEQTGIDFTPLKKSIDKVITDRFDILLAERDRANAEAEAKAKVKKTVVIVPEIKPKANPKPASGAHREAKAEYASSEPYPETSSNQGSVTPVGNKKRKPPALDEDARLAAELHAQLNGGRSTRTSKSKRNKSTTKAKKSRSQKNSKEIVDSDLSGAENDGGTPTKKKRKANPNNAFMKPLILSQPLAAFIGESQMSRPEVVKKIWAYVKAHGLQDPNDKRYIICDDTLKPVFGEKVHMFTMNKVLATNMYKAEEVATPDIDQIDTTT